MNPYLTVDRIEFAVTYRCNAHCVHCQVGDDQRRSRPAALDPWLAGQVVHKVAAAYHPRSVMTFGGEPLLFPDVVCAIHTAAKAAGIPKRQVITNAGWPRASAFRELALKLAESGVNAIHISVDAFHQEHIPLSVVEENARALVEAGTAKLRWNPCWLVSAEHDNPWNRRTRSVLDELAHLPIVEDEGNVVQPEGNATEWLRDYLPPKHSFPQGSCGDMPYTGRLDQVSSISIEPDGGIAVCNEFMIGNAVAGDAVQILRDYDPYAIPEMKAILEGGVSALVDRVRAKGIALDPSGYYSVCGMCVSIRRELGALDSDGTGSKA